MFFKTSRLLILIYLYIPYLEAFIYIGGKFCGKGIFHINNHDLTDVLVCGKLSDAMCLTRYEKG